MTSVGEGQAMSPLENYTRSVARRWKVVIVFAVVGAALASAWLFTTSVTTWTATAALTTQSQERAPEQDAVLALGYVNYFNQASYQQLLHTQVPIPAGVTLDAETGATSPIMYITATGKSAQDARAAAALAAETFREDVRASLVVERRQAAADLQAQVDANVKLLGQRGYNDAVVLDQIRSLQGRMTDIQADNTNMLKQLQPEPGVASTTPSRAFGIVAGAGGGLAIGILVAIMLSVVDRRLRSSAEVRQRTGLDTLAELSAGMDEESRRRVAATVVNTLSLSANECRIVLAVATPRRSRATHQVAMELASTAAGHRSGAVLVQADLRCAGAATRGTAVRGLVDVLDDPHGPQQALVQALNGVKVLGPGAPQGRDPQSLLELAKVVHLVNALSAVAGLVVIELPPILEAAEAQVLAAAADRVVLIVERGVTLAPDAMAARRTLESVGAAIHGAIVVDPAAIRSGTTEMLDTVHVDETRTPRSAGDAGADHFGFGTDEYRLGTDDPAADGGAANGAVAVAAEMNGAMGNGVVTNGAATDKGPAIDDVVTDENPATDGAVVDGAVVDGAVVDGAVVDGAVVDGAVSGVSAEAGDREVEGGAGADADGTAVGEAAAEEEDQVDAPDSPITDAMTDAAIDRRTPAGATLLARLLERGQEREKARRHPAGDFRSS